MYYIATISLSLSLSLSLPSACLQSPFKKPSFVDEEDRDVTYRGLSLQLVLTTSINSINF